MKKILLLTILFFALKANAQNATKDSLGNYKAIEHTHKVSEVKNTGKTFTDNKGNVYPVWESEKGKLFYVRISKNGNEYKVYLKL